MVVGWGGGYIRVSLHWHKPLEEWKCQYLVLPSVLVLPYVYFYIGQSRGKWARGMIVGPLANDGTLMGT